MKDDERLKQTNLANKDNVADFIKKTGFDEKLIYINRKFTWNKKRHVEVEKKANYHITLCKKLINDLKKEVISTKGLTKDFIDK